MPIKLIALRAEESAWFGAQHIGSRAIFGNLSLRTLTTARRVDSDRTLEDHMREAGVDIARLLEGTPLLDSTRMRGFLELHIEQGPILVDANIPLGVVTSIRGNRRCRLGVCQGNYDHSGTVPRSLRSDAVFAVSDLVMRMDAMWHEIEAVEGRDLVMTFGQLWTDPKAHSVTTVPGLVNFSFDCRSNSIEILGRVEEALKREASTVAAARNVRFQFQEFSGDGPIGMDEQYQQRLPRGANELGIGAISIASGAGHDAGDFAAAGVPTAMLFVRNNTEVIILKNRWKWRIFIREYAS
jgi:beta-ureidopropionase / N-carbamoyl-L-amino-acid hydrolase